MDFDQRIPSAKRTLSTDL